MAAKQVNALNIQSAGIPVFDGTATFTETTVTEYDVVVGSSSNALASVAPSATSGVPLISGGSSANPSFGTMVVGGGGTGITSATAYAPICGGTSTTGALQVASTGLSTSGNVFTSNGSSALPSFKPVIGKNLILIQSQTVSTSTASVAFTSGITSTYNTYALCLSNYYPVTNAESLNLNISTNGGVSYITTNYVTGQNRNAYNTATLTNSNTTTSFRFTGAQSNVTSNPSGAGWFFLFNLQNGGIPTMMGTGLNYQTTDLAFDTYQIFSSNTANINVNAIEVKYGVGNIAQGTFSLFGVLE